MSSVSWSSFRGKGQMELGFELLVTTRLCTLVGIGFFWMSDGSDVECILRLGFGDANESWA
jgi:hypothetical protein